MIEFHNPEAPTSVETVPYDLKLPIRGQSVAIALLSNGFPDSQPFLEHLGEAIRRLEPKIETKSFPKSNPTMPADDDLLQEIRSSCTGAIAAYGH